MPSNARTAAEFVALLRTAKNRSGLSYRALERKARKVGDHLPVSTLASVLSRGSLPKEDVVAALIRAFGGDPATVNEWGEVRAALAQRESSARAEDVPWLSQALPGLAAGRGAENEGGGTSRQLVPCLLPADQSLFVGRQDELSTACRVLDREGPGPVILLVTGPAGVGKTAFAVRGTCWPHASRTASCTWTCGGSMTNRPSHSQSWGRSSARSAYAEAPCPPK
jgi:hypothetical protein